jgi:CBS domain-containing protein
VGILIEKMMPTSTEVIVGGIRDRQGIVTWNEVMKVKPEQRNQLHMEQLPVRNLSVFQNESILEAYRVMRKEKIDLVPVVAREAPSKVVGVVTSESVEYAIEKAKAMR